MRRKISFHYIQIITTKNLNEINFRYSGLNVSVKSIKIQTPVITL